jgi:glutaredoxin
MRPVVSGLRLEIGFRLKKQARFMIEESTDNGAEQESITSREIIGSLLFFGGVGLLLFSVFAQAPSFSLPLPRFWYRHERWWPFFAAGLAAVGYLIQHRSSAVSRSWRPSLPGRRFQRVVVYTRQECHLCDVAKDTLHRFAQWLPEIEEIDVDESEELNERYGRSIPVVEIDGVTRFRGVVNETMLKRLIEGTAPQTGKPPSPAD